MKHFRRRGGHTSQGNTSQTTKGLDSSLKEGRIRDIGNGRDTDGRGAGGGREGGNAKTNKITENQNQPMSLWRQLTELTMGNNRKWG